MTNTYFAAKKRRIKRVRSKISGTTERPRLTVHRSLSHLYAQIIDDTSGKTLVALHDSAISAAERKGKKKMEIAALMGKLLAEKAKEKKIGKVVFDRRDKKFHGRVREFAEGARAGGLIF